MQLFFSVAVDSPANTSVTSPSYINCRTLFTNLHENHFFNSQRKDFDKLRVEYEDQDR